MAVIDVKKIVHKFEENPVAFMTAGGFLLTGVGKVIHAAGQARGSNAYARDVNRRIKREKRKTANPYTR